ncbi:hypothetical protein COW36_10565 [bacterium (Candidatus Blackallbacteria) CG17_big_fil_post_rev_8_21_14_2_50_48_46]|uniref:Uncharacterized protein n=1 Tax=bacterium (Candidatus Blackallbacteria) CG17_big_fil_post_rev_8_21_14_2_50_48_46 TaxID=2014261 RepID=A0A2M7G586_9BACT|nr:MAG: hypothetical protein COW64_20340 [bacterium (Candidatus Blackallbacteria) CG18_big_fil_WC_8_21_14_2_50_49_26]PIW17071.1 MAG: hypothetical protein COW36_10565 [bacterium (Candidatus Blackallbacteria) CG17_big_fil_post_rev_8_21_14_2_50_48_46]PIW47694.1 MAG: hypothetical protein COW20_11655 [bacterium (Candidatus Blackallbacteria) CG13_big_fil_rev_8_21_14_2_50_49_14]
MEEKNIQNGKSPSGLGRRKFLALMGKTALGAWLLQLLPTEALALPLPLKKRSNSLPNNRYAARIAVHPKAVKRNK